MLTIKEAREAILTEARSFGEEQVSIEHCTGRVLAEDLVADRDYPPFNRATMDGYAVRSQDVQKPTVLVGSEKIFAGSITENSVNEGGCAKIMTGAPVPEGADAVVRIEDTESENGKIRINVGNIPAGQFIARKGEDALAGDVLVAKGSKCDPPTVSAMAVTGTSSVSVCKRPVVSVISTGNEIRPQEAPVLPHQIRDSNSFALQSFFKEFRIDLEQRLLVEDDPAKLRVAIEACLSSNILILTGGVSMGEADFVPGTLAELGVSKVFHKVQIKPGKPLWFGSNPGGGVVFGLPGNPMSTQVAFKVFIEPYLRACFGMNQAFGMILPLAKSRRKDSPFDSYFPANLIGPEFNRLLPKEVNSSGDITSTLNADGLAIHPADQGDLLPGVLVEFFPW